MPRIALLSRLGVAAATTALVLSCGGDSGGPGDGVDSLAVVSALPDTAVVASVETVTVELLDQDHHAIHGAAVTFTVTAGGGTISEAVLITDASGHAATTWTLGPIIATQTLKIAATGLAPITASVETRHAPFHGFQRLSADPQTVAPGGLVPIAPKVLTVDAYGNIVPGVIVDFVVPGGEGSVATPRDTSGIDGIAATSGWRVGLVYGSTLQLTVFSPGSSAQMAFSAKTALPGDLTWAPPPPDTADEGTLLHPGVLVNDTGGHPIAGLPIRFTITAGPGSLTHDSVLTDTTGHAIADWTVTQAPQATLRAELYGRAPIARTIAVRSPVANDTPLAVIITAPVANARVTGALIVHATIRSTYSLTSVQYQVAGTWRSMTGHDSVWSASISVDSLPEGPTSLAVKATDALGHVSTSARPVTVDRPPGATFTSPVERATLTDSVRITGSCLDSNPAFCSIVAFVTDSVSATYEQLGVWAGAVDTTLPLSITMQSFRSAFIRIEVHDSGGLTTYPKPHLVYIQPPIATLTKLYRAPSLVFDADAFNVLYRTPDSAALVHRTLAGALVDSLPVLSPHGPHDAYLTPFGIIATDGIPDLDGVVRELRNGTVTTTGPSELGPKSGDYALITHRSASPFTIRRRDLMAGATDTMSVGGFPGVVAADGSVAYSALPVSGAVGQLRLFRNGVEVGLPIRDSVVAGVWIFERPALVDQNQLITLRVRNTPGGPGTVNTFTLRSWVGTTPTDLVDLATTQPYLVGDLGWLAYTKPDASNFAQIYTRSPAGVIRQATILNQSSIPEAIGSDGSVVFHSPAGTRYYLAGNSNSPVAVGRAYGNVVWRVDHFYVLMGNTVFRIDP